MVKQARSAKRSRASSLSLQDFIVEHDAVQAGNGRGPTEKTQLRESKGKTMECAKSKSELAKSRIVMPASVRSSQRRLTTAEYTRLAKHSSVLFLYFLRHSVLLSSSPSASQPVSHYLVHLPLLCLISIAVFRFSSRAHHLRIVALLSYARSYPPRGPLSLPP